VRSVYELKPKFQVLLRPVVATLARAGVTANQVTISAVLLSLAAGTWIAITQGTQAALLALPIVLVVRMALNAIDGVLAREHRQQSKLGALLNELGDVTADAALYLPFALVPGVSSPAVVVVVVLAVVSEMTGVLGQLIGGIRRYDGPMGKSDRALVFGALALVLGVGVQPQRWVTWLLYILIALLVITIYNRARRALAEGT
jgi:CDP-diacylglycerol---glycerol-3-phosphate 3-phosphatidyltransferase